MDKKEKILIIVESPTKARTIKRFLPKNYSVVASNGHIRDLPSKDLAIDIEKDYLPKYEIPRGKSKVIKDIKSELATSDALLLATDEDREGESIAWHLVELLKPKVPYQRMVFHEITKRAILHALEHGRELNMDLVNAQEARRILDRLYGYTLSPFLWRKLSLQKLSAGRVQSPGLRMVVQRERERIKFVSSIYWDLKGQLTAASDAQKIVFDARLEEFEGKRLAFTKDFDSDTGALKKGKNVLLLDEQAAKNLEKELLNQEWKVFSVEKKERKQRPSPPFITSTLQQEGSRKLNLSAKETMRIAQKLYESGLITYMRTDSPSLSQEGIRAARAAALELFGEEYLFHTTRQYSSKSASAQEAHEAIRPAGEHFVHPDKTNLSGKEKALYDLIWKRTLASQMADAIKATTTVKIKVGDAIFNATGNTILFAGFIRVYVEGKDDPEAALDDKERLLPNLSEDELLNLVSLVSEEHETKAPYRFTEATLVQQLEKEGIGRPSTYATIIDRLFEKEYVVKEGSALIPTFIGFAVVQLLEDHFKELVDYKFTSHMEDKLDSIAAGKENQLDFLKNFYEGSAGLLSQVEEKQASVKPSDAKKINIFGIEEPYQIMIGKFGPYVNNTKSSANTSLPKNIYPGNISTDQIENLFAEKQSVAKEEPIGIDKFTNSPIYRLTGRFGPYFQLGLATEENPKPKRVSVPKGINEEELDNEFISKLLQLPKVLGKHPESDKDVVAAIGPYGPYVGSDGKFANVKEVHKLLEITLEEAVSLLAEVKGRAKSSRKAEALISFGEHKENELGVFSGRYGFYGKWGKKNFPLANNMKKDEEALKELTKEMMIEFLEKSLAKK